MVRSKKATKKATKRTTKKRASKSSAATRATQLQVMTRARAHFGERIEIMNEDDNTVPGFISTQSLALDWIVGNGGLPQSRIVDVTSDEGCGKSTLADHGLAEVQCQDGHAYLWDTEGARDKDYQARIGLVRKRAAKINAYTMEDGFELMIEVVQWHNEHDPSRPGVIVWDTPAGTPTRNEANPDKTDERMGPAKIIRGYLRKLNQELKKGRWMLFIANQTYKGQSPGGMVYKVAYGGGGIPYFSSVRLKLSHPSKFWRTTRDKELGNPPIGQTVWAQSIKNRCDPPYRSKKICIHFGHGINNTWEVFNVLTGAGAIQQKSGWCTFDPDHSPTLAELYPKSFQAGQDGGHLKLEALVADVPGLWPELLKTYHDIVAGLPK